MTSGAVYERCFSQSGAGRDHGGVAFECLTTAALQNFAFRIGQMDYAHCGCAEIIDQLYGLARERVRYVLLAHHAPRHVDRAYTSADYRAGHAEARRINRATVGSDESGDGVFYSLKIRS